jgi:hypothetical protein
MTGLDVRGNEFFETGPKEDSPVIAAVGPIYCNEGAGVGAKVPLDVVRTDKWTPRAPQGAGYSGINLRAGQVIDALSLELTNGRPSNIIRHCVGPAGKRVPAVQAQRMRYLKDAKLEQQPLPIFTFRCSYLCATHS